MPGPNLTWVDIREAGVPVGRGQDCGPAASGLLAGLGDQSARLFYVPAQGDAEFATPWQLGFHNAIQIRGDGPYSSVLRQQSADQPIIEVAGFNNFVKVSDLLFTRAHGLPPEGAPAIRISSPNGRLGGSLIENCVFEGCHGVFHVDPWTPSPAATRVGIEDHTAINITFRDCVFTGCSGDNIKATMPAYFNNIEFDHCYFESGSFRTFLSFLGSDDYISNMNFTRCTFLGIGSGPSAVAVMELGKLYNATFVNCQATLGAGFRTGTPILVTQGGGSEAAPRDLTFIGCSMRSEIGPIVRTAPAGGSAGTNGQYCILGGSWSAKAPSEIFDLTAGVSPSFMTILGADLGPQASWGGSRVNLYNCRVNGAVVRSREIN